MDSFQCGLYGRVVGFVQNWVYHEDTKGTKKLHGQTSIVFGRGNNQRKCFPPET